MPAAFHNTEQYANNRIECDHGRLKARLRPMRGLKREHTARVIMRGHALMQNIRRGHYELGLDVRAHRRVAHAFTELAQPLDGSGAGSKGTNGHATHFRSFMDLPTSASVTPFP